MKQLHTLLKRARTSKKNLWMLNKLLKFSIPFNKPHGFKITAIEDDGISTFAPYRKKNFNHLKGIHACAIATVGELAAGLSLMNHFSPTQYRFILSNIQIEYHYQAKKDIFAKTQLSSADRVSILEKLEQTEKLLHPVITNIVDADQAKIATVKTIWQIKDWKKVRTQV